MLLLQRKYGTEQISHLHTQSVASTSWVIQHNLGFYPIVRVFTDASEEILPLSIVHDSTNQVTISFTSNTTGTAAMI